MSACAGSTPPSATVQYPTETLTRSTSSTPTQVEPTQTRTPLPSFTPRAIATTIPTQLVSDIPACPGEGQPVDVPAGYNLTGAILYQREGDHALAMIGGSPLKNTLLQVTPTGDLDNFGLSGDGSWLAYSIHPVRSLTASSFVPEISMLSSSGEVSTTQVDLSAAGLLLGDGEFVDYWTGEWFDSASLLIYVRTRFSGRDMGSVAAIYRINPWTGERLNFPAGYEPRDYTHNTQYIWSPDGKQGLYDERDTEPSSTANLVIVSGQEIRNQTTIHLPQLQFGDSDLPLTLENGEWAPDSRMLALRFTHYDTVSDHQLDSHIFIYDSQTNRYIYQCDFLRPADYPKNIVNMPLSLYWSPDSRALLTSIKTPFEWQNNTILFYDFSTRQVYRLVGKAKALGWSSEFKP
jgi:hypothetical protein